MAVEARVLGMGSRAVSPRGNWAEDMEQGTAVFADLLTAVRLGQGQQGLPVPGASPSASPIPGPVACLVYNLPESIRPDLAIVVRSDTLNFINSKKCVIRSQGKAGPRIVGRRRELSVPF